MLLTLFSLLMLAPVLAGATPDVPAVDRVDPFIGTGGEGHTFPGATLPFGMIQVGPDTRRPPAKGGFPWCAGYRHEDSHIVGFSHTHFSGTGHSDLGDILLMPYRGDLPNTPGGEEGSPEGWRSPFSHQREEARPGYYRVYLEKPRVTAELTATRRAALHRYTFSPGQTPRMLLDLVHSIYHHPQKNGWASIQVRDGQTVTGYRRTHGWGPDRVVYFALRFSRPMVSRELRPLVATTYRGFGVKGPSLTEYPEQEGRELLAGFAFETSNQPLLIKVAISGVDVAGALDNLEEIPGWDFDAVRTQAREAWQKALAPLHVQASPQEETALFTALYHSLIAPGLYQDRDGRYRGHDGAIHRAEGFENHGTFSLWDTYRALHPLLTLVAPKANCSMVCSMLAHQTQSLHHMLPVWSFHGQETWCMIGYHAVSVIADAYLKGTLEGLDASKALQAMVQTAENTSWGGLTPYQRYGFVPIDLEKEGASKTQEYAYDDWAIARMARALGQTDLAERFDKRAQSWKAVFDPRSGFMRARNSDGTWREPFDPFLARYGGDYTEGNAWQYSWYVPQDVAGLIRKLGGRKAFVQRLETLFTLPTHRDRMAEVEDIAGLIGQYAHGNEPSHHIAYLFNWADRPDRTQYWLGRIMDHLFNNSPQGLPGNEDCGQMSAWYLFTSLGFYPVCPGTGEYVLGRPFLDRAELRLPSGKIFLIHTRNRGPQAPFLVDVQLNGKTLGRSYIRHQEIMAGGELRFIFGSTPDNHWAGGAQGHPYSQSTHKENPS